MTGDDLAHLLRFLYGDARGLGLAAAAADMGTRVDRLREMLADKRPIPEPWQDYLVLRTYARSTLDAWTSDYSQLARDISAPTWARIVGLKHVLVHF